MSVASTMTQPARITITSGPDRGQTFEVGEEITYIGSEADQYEIALKDPGLNGHVATIMFRGGRYAISTPVDDLLQVDENLIPADRWVWLPEMARVRVGRHTAFQFQSPPGSGGTANGSAGPVEEPAAARRSSRGVPKVRRPGSQSAALQTSQTEPPPLELRETKQTPQQTGGRRTARFITDRPGETLVRLGEDGQLPELKLAETASGTSDDTTGRPSSPVALYAVLGMSVAMSMAMLVIDASPQSGAEQRRELARQLITKYYGSDEESLEPYQQLLREARLARSRDDTAAEWRAYHGVLELLNSEDASRSFTGLTGARTTDDDRDLGDRYYNTRQGLNDRELRRLISALLTR